VRINPPGTPWFDADLELYHASDSAVRAADQARSHADEMRKIELRRAATS